MRGLEFFKMTGGGNDFILIPDFDRRLPPEEFPRLAQRLCQRRFSVGADGMIVLWPSERAHFRWHFYNADGSRAEMCGNGGRCAARLAHHLGIAPRDLAFETDVGIVEAKVEGRRVRITLPSPTELRTDLEIEVGGKRLRLDYINTGVPHAVLFVDDLEGVDVVGLGRAIRWHEAFAPKGTNVDFVKVEGGRLYIRTYERGVEDETMACGTGATAAALLASLRGLASSPTEVVPRGAEPLVIHYRHEGGFREVALEGEVRIVFRGTLEEA